LFFRSKATAFLELPSYWLFIELVLSWACSSGWFSSFSQKVELIEPVSISNVFNRLWAFALSYFLESYFCRRAMVGEKKLGFCFLVFFVGFVFLRCRMFKSMTHVIF
jgi:hypothetical protein